VNLTELVQDQATFSALREECDKIIDTQKRLPEFVFQRSFAKYFAIEHAHVSRKAFGAFLFKMSNLFEDQLVNYMTVQPDPVDYYYRHLSFFGLASFVPSNLVDRYVPVMSREGSPDSFRARGGDVGVFWGSSLKWGIFCDRISWELAVVAVSENIDMQEMSAFRCMDASILSAYMKSQYSRDASIGADFTRRFLSNYPL
jgi:hypothetical protein